MSNKIWNSSAPKPIIQLNGQSFSDYKKDYNLENLLTGKKVVFVGPSSHLEGSESGSLIDSYDIVVRAGQTFEIPKYEQKDYGKRTDIICHSFNSHQRVECLKHIDFFKSLKFVICSMVSLKQIGEHKTFFPKLKVPYQNVDDRYILRLWEDVGTVVNSGFAGLIVLLHYDVKEIYVTGMNFYNMGKYGDVYYQQYIDEATGAMKNVSKKSVKPQDARADLHNQRAQILYFKKIYEQNKDVIKLDNYLKENLLNYE